MYVVVGFAMVSGGWFMFAFSNGLYQTLAKHLKIFYFETNGV